MEHRMICYPCDRNTPEENGTPDSFSGRYALQGSNHLNLGSDPTVSDPGNAAALLISLLPESCNISYPCKLFL